MWTATGPLHLPHVGQEEPGVDIAGDNVQERDHPEKTRPSNKSVTNPEVAAGLKPPNKMHIVDMIPIDIT